MSTISASASTLQTYAPPRAHSGKGRITSEIGNEVSAGTLSATDATALTKALDSIDTSLSTDSSSSSTDGASASTGSKTRLDPSQMKDRIDGLINDQVTGGSLTSDQASTLKGLFAQQGGPQGASGSGQGHHGAGGPPPDQSGIDASSATDSTSTSGSSASDLLASFIQQLQASQSSGSGYAASGTSGTSTNASALLFDFQS